MTDPRKNVRSVRAPRGSELNAKYWTTEAPLRMLMNNLDAEVAENPNELVVVKREKDLDEIAEKREEVAEMMGFDAYGSTQDMPDPVADTVNRMLDHIHAMDDRMDKMCTQLSHLGSDVDFGPAPSLKDLDMIDCGTKKKP